MYLFVYGTLMTGQRANYMLFGCERKGRFVLNDYAMYDLGSYPGIVPKEGESVVGEVYAIRGDMLPSLDSYEGEGFLYIRESRTVHNNAESVEAYVYVYNNIVEESRLMRTMWGLSADDEIWYACYGSNLSAERFRCYIEGGVCAQNGRNYPGCSDKTPWSDEAVMTFGGKLYFGNESGSWEGKGVAFYDPDAKGKTYMRLYKIKYSQFLEVRRMEGASDRWYGRAVCLGVKDDRPVYTLTSARRRPANTPCRAYLTLIADAMRNELSLSADEVLGIVINSVTE